MGRTISILITSYDIIGFSILTRLPHAEKSWLCLRQREREVGLRIAGRLCRSSARGARTPSSLPRCAQRSSLRCRLGLALVLLLLFQVERRKAEAERAKQEEKRKKAQKLLAEPWRQEGRSCMSSACRTCSGSVLRTRKQPWKQLLMATSMCSRNCSTQAGGSLGNWNPSCLAAFATLRQHFECSGFGFRRSWEQRTSPDQPAQPWTSQLDRSVFGPVLRSPR